MNEQKVNDDNKKIDEKETADDKEDEEDEEDVEEGADPKKPKKKKNKKKKKKTNAAKQQTDPPSIPIKELFPNHIYPLGESLDHPVSLSG